MFKWIPLLSLTAATGAVVACMNGPKATPTAAAVKSVSKTRLELQSVNVTQMYEQNCANCHGAKGQGGGAGTKTLNTKDLFQQDKDKRFFDAIKNGLPESGMEAFGKTHSDEEVWSLVVHIREMQNASLRNEFGGPKATDGVYTAKTEKYRLETVIPRSAGLKVPWSVDWLPDGKMLITNRTGVMNILEGGTLTGVVNGLPKTYQNGQGGLMDVAVHPQYAKNGWIYLSFSDTGKENPNNGFTKIVRGKLKFEGSDAQWTEQQTIYEAAQSEYSGGGVHFGNRTAFDGKGHVFVAYGERGQGMPSQDLSRTTGKILRLNEDGTVPKDNPFVGKPGAIGAIWSYGHRNPQGLVMGLDGVLWDTEHGPRGGDELNRIDKGANYGWPLVAFSINYNDSATWTPWPKPEQKIVLPELRWIPSIAASGLDVVKGSAFPSWKGDLVAGGLAGSTVIRVKVKGGKYVEQEELIHGIGRVRDVAVSPAGEIFVILNDPDSIVKLVPVK
ncbi:MAG: PQQ-dependent sugar dehydrogenase [Armatimonadetes bacterium]|nr:PQQ-dependent sugar dehydrogenase [Armatimonadota bacterium]